MAGRFSTLTAHIVHHTVSPSFFFSVSRPRIKEPTTKLTDAYDLQRPFTLLPSVDLYLPNVSSCGQVSIGAPPRILYLWEANS